MEASIDLDSPLHRFTFTIELDTIKWAALAESRKEEVASHYGSFIVIDAAVKIEEMLGVPWDCEHIYAYATPNYLLRVKNGKLAIEGLVEFQEKDIDIHQSGALDNLKKHFKTLEHAQVRSI